MNIARTTFLTLILGALLITVGALAGWWWGRAGTDGPGTPTAASGNERPVLYWYDPMAPQHHFDKPGKSAFMDMDLVPRYADEETSAEGAPTGVRIAPQVAQNIGLREAVVERVALVSVIEATGLLTFNERDVTIEQAPRGGRVERVWPLAPGDVIDAGQPLVELLVPEWSAAQGEFLVLRATGDPALVAAARERLRLLGMPAALIDELENTARARQSFVLKSSRAGMLESLDVRSGMTLESGQSLARIQGIGSVWLEVAVPESRATAVQVGNLARVQLAAYPGATFDGQVAAVLPILAPASRTLRVRIELPNPHGELRAGMSAQVRLESGANDVALSVPTEAIIRTGKRALVMAVQEEGRYAPVEVELGREIDNRTVIAAGLQEGQKVVASAQFLLDSEASLSGVFAGDASAEPAPAPHRHDAVEGQGAQP